jgi:predicted phosphohydrolase
MAIEWDGGEKFYNYTEWLVYLINKVLAPNGYVLNGVVEWSGEETGDVGEITVEDNKVFVQEWKGNKQEITPQNVGGYMRTDVVLVLDGELDSVQKSLMSFRLDTNQ